MMSRAYFSMAPSRPAGWKLPNCAAVKPRLSSSAIASASPIASCISEDVVGARLCGHASRASGSASVTSAAWPSVESVFEVIPIRLTLWRREYSIRLLSSAVSPDQDSAMMTSASGAIMPRSPWPASAAWMKKAGVPVEARVAAILRAMCPDLPMPVTITRPGFERIRSMAATKVAPSPLCRAAESALSPPASTSRARTADAIKAP